VPGVARGIKTSYFKKKSILKKEKISDF